MPNFGKKTVKISPAWGAPPPNPCLPPEAEGSDPHVITPTCCYNFVQFVSET